MPNYLHVAAGTMEGAWPWSFRWYSTSTVTESVAETSWSAGIAAMFATAGFLPMYGTQTVLTETSTSTMDSAWHQTTKTTTTHSQAGSATQSLPLHTAVVVTWRTANATRSGRGRWYLPALSVGSLATNGYVLSSTAVGEVVSAVNVFLGSIAGTLNPVLLHRHGNKSGTLPALSTSPIISGDVGDGYDVQRRRGDKRVEARQSLTF